MMKFENINYRYGCVLYDTDDEKLIQIGDIILFKEEMKEKSFCEKCFEDHYNYYRIENAVCGRTRYIDYHNENVEWKGECFTPKRILVIQME